MFQRRGGPGNFTEYPERARGAGRKSGPLSGGNGTNSCERALEAGRTGGKISRRPSSEKTAQ
ncbi:MAG: stress-induced protein [Pantoea sp.]|nr:MULTISPECIES: stress-induced protein [Pantoea]MDU5779789.1 stress-induced protein [Pantoea sp.]